MLFIVCQQQKPPPKSRSSANEEILKFRIENEGNKAQLPE